MKVELYKNIYVIHHICRDVYAINPLLYKRIGVAKQSFLDRVYYLENDKNKLKFGKHPKWQTFLMFIIN